jgi:uncharacterized protein YodC (DUF2158 family)
MQEQDVRQWTVGETVRLRDDERLMTVVRCHADGEISVAWFEQRKMHLERVPADRLEPVTSEVIPPGVQRRN